MNYIKCQIELENILNGKVDGRFYKNIPALFDLLKNKFDFSTGDMFYLCAKFPFVLTYAVSDIERNLKQLEEVIDLKCKNIKCLVLKFPFLLILKSEIFVYKVNLILALLGVSKKNAFSIMLVYPDLLFVSKQEAIIKIKQLSKKLNEYGLCIKKHFRSEPRLIFSSLDNLDEIKKLLMRKYTLSEDEVNYLFKCVPSFALEALENVEDMFNKYYPAMFIKRDLKEMLSFCPEFVLLDAGYVAKNIKDIEDIFNISNKKACEFVRNEPNIMLFPSPKNKILGFKNLSINKDYVKLFPSICREPEISIAIKFVITRSLGLEDCFNEICEMDTNVFVSRFIFMQTYKIFNHRDLVLGDDAFEKKYNFASSRLVKMFRPTTQIFENICKYYYSQRNTIPNWSDICLPEVSSMVDYLTYSKLNYASGKNYPKFKEFNISRNKYLSMQILASQNLNINEVCLVLAKNPLLASIASKDMARIIDILRRYGYSQERIVKLLLLKPSLFSYPIRDFELLLEEICQHEECDWAVAIEKFMC